MKIKEVKDSSEKELIQKLKEKFNLQDDDFTINEKGHLIKINSENPEAHRELAYQLFEKDLLDEAILEYGEVTKYCEKAVETDPKNIESWNKLATTAWYNMGLAYTFMSNYPKAVECYEKLLNINPKDVEALYNLGGIHAQNRQFDEATKYLKKVLELEPNNPQFDLAWFTIGYHYANIRQFDEAFKYLKKASELDPNNPLIKQLITEIEKEEESSKPARQES